jgi:hypothetical protein
MVEYLRFEHATAIGPIAAVALVAMATLLVCGVAWSMRSAPDLLDKQVHRRRGVGLALASAVEIVLVLWRLLDLGEWRLVPYLGAFIVFVLAGYGTWYLAIGSKRARERFTGWQKQYRERELPSWMRGRGGYQAPLGSLWALGTGAIGAILFYMLMFPSTDHALHQVMILRGARWATEPDWS